MEEQNLAPHLFLAQVRELLSNPNILAVMGERSAKFATPYAARYMAEEIIEIST
jgi:UDP-N-acetylglucosamine:LPS N-acetylglucosamine transferase